MSVDNAARTTEPASHVYRVDVIHASRPSRWLRTAAVVALNVLNYGGTPTNPGGRRAQVVDRVSGEVVATISEFIGDDDSEVDAVAADVDRMDIATFSARWL